MRFGLSIVLFWLIGCASTPSHTIAFEKETLDPRSDDSLKGLLVDLDRGKDYVLSGYSCGSEKADLELGIRMAEQRAKTVRDYLVKRGFQTHRFSTLAAGKAQSCEVRINRL